jgi:hypothetical protein
MDRWQKHLEVAINVAVLLAFVAVGALATKRFFQNPAQDMVREPQVGASISLPGVDWGASNVNLVMALSTGCHFCSESAVFYKRLVPFAAAKGIRVLAVLPQSVSDDRAYLDNLGVRVSEIVESPLGRLDVSGTPTLLVLDAHGRIKRAWVGKLDSDGERQVLASLQP